MAEEWFAVCEDATGNLVSVGTVVADPLPDGLVSVRIGETAPADTARWNPTTRAFEDFTPDKWLTELEVFRWFTFQEEAAIRTAQKSDVMVDIFLERLRAAGGCHLQHAETAAGVGYMLRIGILTQERHDSFFQQ